MSKHAFLSASSSHRWLKCPPSAKLCESIVDSPSPYAQEGTDCHELCAYLVEKALGMDVKDPTENLTFYSKEMQNNAEEYRNFVIERLEEARIRCKDPLILIEQRLDFSRWVKNGFGTGDCIIVSEDVLEVIDYKNGLGILVDADNNSQMMCYALGALMAFDGLYDIKEIRMTIFQPRRDNISTFTMNKEDLLFWGDNILAPIAKLASDGMGEFAAGDHCQFCKAKATCRKRAEYNQELAQYDFELPSLLSDEEIAEILPRIEQLSSWCSDVKDYALSKAQSGTRFNGFKLVEGRSVRKYMDESTVAAVIEGAGYDPYEKKLMGITAMSNMLGKKTFNELLSELIVRPQGKPTLVPESDKRPEINNFDEFEEEK